MIDVTSFRPITHNAMKPVPTSRNHDYRIICITPSNAGIELQAPHHVGSQYNRDEGRFQTGRIPASNKARDREDKREPDEKERERESNVTFFSPSMSNINNNRINTFFFFESNSSSN